MQDDNTDWLLAGSKLSADEAGKLEKCLSANPTDLKARLTLLGYYFLRRDESSRAKRKDIVIWLIDNMPDLAHTGEPWCDFSELSETANFNEIKDHWLLAVKAHPSNSAVFANAAHFLARSDKALAEEYFNRAIELDPKNSSLLSKLATFLSLHVPKKQDEAVLSIKKAMTLEPSANKQKHLKLHLVQHAYSAGEYATAADAAKELLSLNDAEPELWKDGQIEHDCNSILGLIAIQNGDIVGAKNHLTLAGQSSGSPALGSFGPDFSLAYELLNEGCRGEVIAYLHACKIFWKSEGGRLDSWIAEIDKGKMPDFRKIQNRFA